MSFPFNTIYLMTMMLALASCHPEPVPRVSFYHWKSYWDINTYEDSLLTQMDVQGLYVRYFDIDLGQAVGKLLDRQESPIPSPVVPTVFITHRSFQHSQERAALEDLAQKTIRLIQSTHRKVSQQPIRMVQMDCDWTPSTQAAYFQFLDLLKQQSGWDISVTIRLHQVKYHKQTGIPPADHFVLMCYNTGSISDWEEQNSILDVATVGQYLNGSDYPRRLDIALPLFAWAALFREGKLIKIIRNVRADDFSDSRKFLITANRVEVLRGTYLNAYYLYSGDELRLESVPLATLEETSRLLARHFSPREIIFYHLDSTVVQQYNWDGLEKIIEAF